MKTGRTAGLAPHLIQLSSHHRSVDSLQAYVGPDNNANNAAGLHTAMISSPTFTQSAVPVVPPIALTAPVPPVAGGPNVSAAAVDRNGGYSSSSEVLLAIPCTGTTDTPLARVLQQEEEDMPASTESVDTPTPACDMADSKQETDLEANAIDFCAGFSAGISVVMDAMGVGEAFRKKVRVALGILGVHQ